MARWLEQQRLELDRRDARVFGFSTRTPDAGSVPPQAQPISRLKRANPTAISMTVGNTYDHLIAEA